MKSEISELLRFKSFFGGNLKSEHNLSRTDVFITLLSGTTNKVTTTELYNSLSVDKALIYRRLCELEERGYIVRGEPGIRRKRSIMLTGKSKIVFDAFESPIS